MTVEGSRYAERGTAGDPGKKALHWQFIELAEQAALPSRHHLVDLAVRKYSQTRDNREGDENRRDIGA